MAYIKILNLRSVNAIRNASKYITDEKKTGAVWNKAKDTEVFYSGKTSMVEGIEIGDEEADIPDAINKLVNYTGNAGKTKEGRLVTGINCTVHHTADEMKSLVEYWKDRRRITGVSRDAFHIIQSFNPGDNERISPEVVHEIGHKFARELQYMDDKAEVNRRYMMLLCTHVDRLHIHNHIVMCSYDIDTGRKFHECREVYRQMKEASDRLCREYGLSIIPDPDLGRRNSRSEWEAARKGTSWKDELRKNIEAMRSVSRSWDEYVRNMEAVGYHLRQGKYVTYTDQEGHRVRDKSLGREWTKESIEGSMEKRTGTMGKADGSREKIKRFYLEQEELRRREMERFADTVSPYDEDGRRRSELEKILLAAMHMVLEGEAYGIGDGYTIAEDAKERGETRKKKRYQKIADILEMARSFGIGTEEELKSRLDGAGKELSHVNLEIKKNQSLLNKMDIIAEAVNEYEQVKEIAESTASMPEGKEKEEALKNNQEAISRYKMAKSVLYRYRCVTDVQIADFRIRQSDVQEKLKTLRRRSMELRKEYKNLMKIKAGLELARNESFLQGRLYAEDDMGETMKPAVQHAGREEEPSGIPDEEVMA